MLASSAKYMALRHRAFYIVLAMVLQPCMGPCDEWSAIDINSKADLTRSPFDYNLSDMKWSVANYKPRDLVTGEKLPFKKGDRRLVFRGKGQGLNNFAILGGVYGRGMFSLGSTIALDDTKGLRDGVTGSWVQADYDDNGTTTSHQVFLQYRAQFPLEGGSQPGWEAQAFIDGVLQGQKQYPGVASIDVRLVQFDDRLEFLSRPTPANPYGVGEEGAAPFDLLFQGSYVPPTKFTIGLGAFGLDKGGEIYTDMLWFLGPNLGPDPESAEFFIFDEFSLIGSCLKDAKSQISSPSVSLTNVSGALSQVSSARSAAISTMLTLKDGLKNDIYAEKAAAKIASKIGRQTYKKLNKIENQLQSMLDKSTVNMSQIKGICNSLESLTQRSTVGQANMLGVRVRSYNQLSRVGYDIPAGDLPDIFGF